MTKAERQQILDEIMTDLATVEQHASNLSGAVARDLRTIAATLVIVANWLVENKSDRRR